jgi:group I intron endonuclease
MMKNGVIYCAISPSGKKYYGLSSNFRKRKEKHRKNYKKIRKNYFYTAIRKYGFENIEWIIVETVNSDSLIELRILLAEREKYWIKKDKTYLKEYGYNMTLGGEGKLGFSNSIKTRLKMSEAKKNMSQETKNKIRDYRIGKSSGMAGKLHSKKTKEKISNSLLGEKRRPFSEETKKRMSESHNKRKGVSPSKETREKIRNSQIGRIFTDNHRKKLSDSAKKRERKPMSDETKEKIRLSCIASKNPKTKKEA